MDDEGNNELGNQSLILRKFSEEAPCLLRLQCHAMRWQQMDMHAKTNLRAAMNLRDCIICGTACIIFWYVAVYIWPQNNQKHKSSIAVAVALQIWTRNNSQQAKINLRRYFKFEPKTICAIHKSKVHLQWLFKISNETIHKMQSSIVVTDDDDDEVWTGSHFCWVMIQLFVDGRHKRASLHVTMISLYVDMLVKMKIIC